MYIGVKYRTPTAANFPNHLLEILHLTLFDNEAEIRTLSTLECRRKLIRATIYRALNFVTWRRLERDGLRFVSKRTYEYVP